jgi:hypothetical protein
MYAFNVFSTNFLKVWFFYECLKTLRNVNFCTAYSVHVEDFLPHTHTRRRIFTAYSVHENIFYSILSRRGIFFTAYSVGVE